MIDFNKDMLINARKECDELGFHFHDADFHVQYGEWMGIYGDIHVDLGERFDAVSFKEITGMAEELGGSTHVTEGHEWGDFDRLEDARRFFESVFTLNAERMKEAEMKHGHAEKESLVFPVNDRDIINRTLGEYLNKVNSDFYNIKDMDIPAVVKEKNPGSWEEVKTLARSVMADILQEFRNTNPDRFEGYGITDIGQESLLVAMEAQAFVKGVYYNHVNNMDARIGQKLAEVNAMKEKYNALWKATDPNYMFEKPVTSYSVEKFDADTFAIRKETDSSLYLTSKINSVRVLEKLGELEKEMVSRFPELRNGREKEVAEQQRTVITDVHVNFPVSKDYYISAKINGRQMLRVPISRKEAMDLVEGNLDVMEVARKHYSKQIDTAEKHKAGLKR